MRVYAVCTITATVSIKKESNSGEVGSKLRLRLVWVGLKQKGVTDLSQAHLFPSEQYLSWGKGWRRLTVLWE